MSKYQSTFKYKIVDDGSIHTNYILSGKQLSEEAKKITVWVTEYCVEHFNSDHTTATQQQIYSDVKQLFADKHGKVTFNDLVQLFGAESSFECLMSYLLTGFMSGFQTDPMKLLMYTYGRALPLDGAHEWMDNFRINNLGYPMNMFVWGKYDNETNFSVHQQEPEPINTSVELPNYERVYNYIVTPFRGIIIHNEQGIAYDDYKAMCDACYLRYPCCFCGAHGCDVYDIKDMSLSVEEITQVIHRYPSWHIQYVLNTATYASHNGTHWVALELTAGHAKLICSQGSSFGCFADNGKLANSLSTCGFRHQWNNFGVQRDGYNCGIFSPIALYMLLIHDGDITKAVKEGIGENGVNIHGTDNSASNINEVRKKLIGSK